MKIECPRCRRTIGASGLNALADLAVCDRCSEAFSISALVHRGNASSDFDAHLPPSGAWFHDSGSCRRVGATMRSFSAIFLIPFAAFWISITVGGFYGNQFARGRFDLVMSLFGIPFLIGAVVLIWMILLSICGKVEVTTEGDEGSVFEGVGAIGWTWRFRWPEVTAVIEDRAPYGRSTRAVIALVGQSRLTFGSGLTESRRYYMLQTLRSILADRNANDWADRRSELLDERFRADRDR